MKKLLLLTYFFPPANFAGSYRVASFAKYLHRFGWYPVVVTRQFKEGTASFHQLAEGVGTEVIHEVHEGYEVYRLPYRANLRDRLFHRYGDRKFVWLRKALSLLELVLQNFTTRVVPYRNLYTFSLELLRKDPEIRLVLASGNPYQLFHFCYRLHQKTGIPWVADYRDEWTTNPFKTVNTVTELFLQRLNQYAESKYLRKAIFFISVSEGCVNSLKKLLNKDGFAILNGYDPEDVFVGAGENNGDEDHKPFIIVYNGTLYPTQPLELFINALLKFIECQENRPNLICRFIGSGVDPIQVKRIENLIKGYESYFEITRRVSKTHAVAAQKEADLLLMLSYGKHTKGIISSKLFEYIATGRPMLMVDFEDNEVKNILSGYKPSLFVSSPTEIHKALSQALERYKSGKPAELSDTAFQEKFTRLNQVKVLSKYLDDFS